MEVISVETKTMEGQQIEINESVFIRTKNNPFSIKTIVILQCNSYIRALRFFVAKIVSRIQP